MKVKSMSICEKSNRRFSVYSGCIVLFICFIISACSNSSSTPSTGTATVKIPDYYVSLNSFELPQTTTADKSQLTNGKPIATLALQVTPEDQFLDNLEIAVNLRIPGKSEPYRLNVKTQPTMTLGEIATVSNVYVGEPRYLTLYLYLPKDAYDLLTAIKEATTCQLEITMDPQSKVSLSKDSDKTASLSIEYLPDNLFVWQPDGAQFEKYFGGDKHEYKSRYNYNKPVKSPGDYMEMYAAMTQTESAKPYNVAPYGDTPWTASRHLHQYNLDTLISLPDTAYKPFNMDYQIRLDVTGSLTELFIYGYSDGKEIYKYWNGYSATGARHVFEIPPIQGNIGPKVIERHIYWYEDLTFKLTFSGTYSFMMAGWIGLQPDNKDVASVEIENQTCQINLDVVPSMEHKNFTIKADSKINLINWTQQGNYKLRNRFPSPTLNKNTAWHWLQPYGNPHSFMSGDGKMVMVRLNKESHEMYPHAPMTSVVNLDREGASYATINDPKAPEYWTNITKPTYRAD